MAKSGQILFLRKNFIDLDKPNPIITITDSVASNTGQASVNQMRNRNNISGWLTTNSDDSANTEILIETGDTLPVDFIELVKHNFKDYVIEYQDESEIWQIYETVTNNTKATTIHQKDTPIQSNRFRITVNATMVADQDKEMRQLIITQKKYQFEGWPVIKKPISSTNKRTNKVISGKYNVVDTRGNFSCTLEIKLSGSEQDLMIHQDLYNQREGVLMLISGADELQFRTLRKNYRDEDIVLVKPLDEYENPYSQGVYLNGIKIKIKLGEVIF